MKRTYVLRDAQETPRFRIDYAERLNPQQLAVVEAGTGPMLVIAGAGTGKTHTLTHRVARLIESGTAPRRILLLTFTNRAAREMLDRVGRLLDMPRSGVTGGTFHSVANRLLREHAPALGYPENFSILDGEDVESLLRRCVQEIERRHPDQRFPRPSVLARLHSFARNTGADERDVLLARYPQFSDHMEDVERVLLLYTQRKLEFGLMDFDDLLLNWQRLLLEHPGVADALRARFDHVLVDEYQDTNRLQAEIVDRMVDGHRNLMVVGDDAQSIYRFRGAAYENILAFEDRYPDAARWLLEINYRSSPEILALANRSIAKNTRQFEKRLVSQQSPGAAPALIECADEDQQSAFLGQRILELRDEGVALDQVAVLYRAHRHSMNLQIELSRRGIPFVVRSGQRFFEQRHIKDVLSFLRWLDNPRDELSFSRMAMLCEGVGPATANKLFLYLSSWPSIREALGTPGVERILPSRARPRFEAFRTLLMELDTPALRSDASMAIERIRETFYEEYAAGAFDNASHRSSELATLSEYAAQQGDVRTLLDRLSLSGVLSGRDVEEPSEEDEPALVLSTIHQAKGLEFDAVFVPWLAEQSFPSERAAQDEEELEEERRLFYVALTRARRQLYLLRPLMSWDRSHGRIVLRPSRFLGELDGQPALWERWMLQAG